MKNLPILLMLFIISIFISCDKSLDPINQDCSCDSNNNQINLIFKYGVSAKNILNTFDCSYAKDMILDPSIKVFLKLNNIELNSIRTKMDHINFFNYSDTFKINVSSDTIPMVTPFSTYYFYIESDTLQKVLFWRDEIPIHDGDADRLRELIELIIEIIKSKKEYKKLPPARGGYD